MTLAPVITLILLLLIGAGLAFRSKGKEHSSKGLTSGLVLFGLGLFGLLNYPLDALYAAIAVVAVLLIVPWAITGSAAAVIQGVIAVVIIVVLGLLFRLTPAAIWLGDATSTIGSNSSDLGGIITDWLPEDQPQP
jgi:hypothetical protein